MSKKKPADLLAAYTAALSAHGGKVTFDVGGEQFVVDGAAAWSEAKLKAVLEKNAFDLLREVMGADEYARLERVVEQKIPDGMPWGLAQKLQEQYFRDSGLASQAAGE